ncbi:hypothetical protein RHGRI_024000 [Rhododendron griersonianum]|uniref:Uncharacterized protein n=1 Tax=Rhododendron griersonianum TaxID=479676 RepID=A0AAV6J7K8_9ERIC|nr:hypothetical protein RHGRI_024000 [Rhododendron griersonianum]
MVLVYRNSEPSFRLDSSFRSDESVQNSSQKSLIRGSRGIRLRLEPRTRRPFPALELYTQELAGPFRPNNRKRNRRTPSVTVVAQRGKIVILEGIPQTRIQDSGASSSGRTFLISPSEIFANPDMSCCLNLPTMVGRSGSHPASASPSSTPATRTPASGSSPRGLLADAQRKRSRRDAFREGDDEDQLSLSELQALNAASDQAPTPPPVSSMAPSSSSSPTVWAQHSFKATAQSMLKTLRALWRRQSP